MHRVAIFAVLLLSLAVENSASAQQSTTTAEVRQFEVLAVDGNNVVVRGERGTQELTVPPEFRLTVDGRAVTVQELKPGMKGTARITTTTTVTPVYVTEVRNGTVMQRSGNSIIVRNENGIRMFSEGEISKRKIRLMRDGKPIELSNLTTGDRLTAVIVTEQAPRVMTERDVEASLESVKAAPPAVASTAPPPDTGTAPAPAPAPIAAAPVASAPAPTADTSPVEAAPAADTAPVAAVESSGSVTWLVVGGIVVLVIAAIALMRRRKMVS